MTICPNLTDDQVKMAFSKFDTSGDDKLDYREFCEMIRQKVSFSQKMYCSDQVKSEGVQIRSFIDSFLRIPSLELTFSFFFSGDGEKCLILDENFFSNSNSTYTYNNIIYALLLLSLMYHIFFPYMLLYLSNIVFE